MSLPRITGAVIAGAVLGACARRYQTTFNSPLLEPRPASEATQSGINVAIEPITRENLLHFPDLAREATWREPDPGGQHPIGAPPPLRVQLVERSAIIALVPLPAFRVSIANRSEQLTSFGPAIELEDDLQRQYRPIRDTESLRSRFVRDMFGTNSSIARDASLMRPFTHAIDDLAIFTPTLSIEPGGRWTGYALFETGAIGADDYNVWMSSVQTFTLRLQSSIGESNGPQFVFNLDKLNRMVSLSCPSYAKVPSLEKCSRIENTTITGSGITRPEGER